MSAKNKRTFLSTYFGYMSFIIHVKSSYIKTNITNTQG